MIVSSIEEGKGRSSFWKSNIKKPNWCLVNSVRSTLLQPYFLFWEDAGCSFALLSFLFFSFKKKKK